MKKQVGIIISVIVLIILGGIITWVFKGFNIAPEYAKTTKVEVRLSDELTKENVQQIFNEMYENETVKYQDVEFFNERMAVTVYNFTDEQKTELLEKINTTYNLEYTEDDISVIQVAGVKFTDVVGPYVAPTIIGFIIALVYIAIIDKKNILKNILMTVMLMVLAIVLLVSMILILQIPVSIYVMPCIIAVLLIIITLYTSKI